MVVVVSTRVVAAVVDGGGVAGVKGVGRPCYERSSCGKVWLRYRLKNDMKEKVNKGRWRIRGNALTVVGLPEVGVEEEKKVILVVLVKMSCYLLREPFMCFKNISQVAPR